MMLTPFLSVIVPVHRGVQLLPDTLGALLGSSLPRDQWELIVVDDASPDETATVAASYADKVIHLEAPPCGPGGARNAGAKIAKGSWLVFVDADVRVHTDTLSRFVDRMRAEPELVAIFGTYDEHPEAPGLVSVYRNLLHRYVHLRGAGESETFWAGLGAVRAGPFSDVGGFDTPRFPRPQIEDIDLGYRLRDRGGRILLDPSIQGTHLKRWTLMAMLRTDIRDRGIPWMRLLLERRGRTPTSLNTGRAEQAKVVLAGVGLGLLSLGLISWTGVLGWAGGLSLLALTFWNVPAFGWFLDRRGPAFALATIPLLLLYYVGNAFSALAGLAHYAAGRRLEGVGFFSETVAWAPAYLPPARLSRPCPDRGGIMTLSDDSLSPSPPRSESPPELLLAFYPLHKAAFGAAVGACSFLVLFLATAIVVLRADHAIPLELLAQYLKGYRVSWGGALIGALWAGFVGFVFGWFTAFCRNLVLTVSLFVIRTRAELAQTRDFLDHI